MKAICIHEFGDEGVLQYEEVPEPSFGRGDVLVRVRASSPQHRWPSPRSSAGTWQAMYRTWDRRLTTFRVGQRVVVRLPEGGYAELAAASATVVVPLPDEVDYDQAASLPVAFLTAWLALLDTAKLTAGETALVQAAGSGVGMAGVQIAKYVARAQRYGLATAYSFTTCGRPRE